MLEPSVTIEYTTDGTVQERMETLREIGFTTINLASPTCRHLLCTGKWELQRLKSDIRSLDLQVDWLHTPYRLPILYEPQTEWYHVSMGAMKTCLQMAAELGASNLIIHPMNKQFPEEIDRGPTLDHLVESFAVLVESAKTYGVTLAVENIDEPYSTNILSTLFDRIEDLKFCFDAGHAELWNSWDSYLPRYTDRLAALHVHDNHGHRDEHLIPGDGTINFQPFVHLLNSTGYTGHFGLECAQSISQYPGDRAELAAKIWDRTNSLLNVDSNLQV